MNNKREREKRTHNHYQCCIIIAALQYAGITLFYLLHAFCTHQHSVSTPWDLINVFSAY